MAMHLLKIGVGHLCLGCQVAVSAVSAENRSEVCRNTHVRAPAPAGAERDGTEVRVPHAVTRGRSVGGDCVGPARSWRARWRSGDASKGREPYRITLCAMRPLGFGIIVRIDTAVTHL